MKQGVKSAMTGFIYDSCKIALIQVGRWRTIYHFLLYIFRQFVCLGINTLYTSNMTEEINNFRFETMEKNIEKLEKSMNDGFDKIFARFDSMNSQYPSMRDHMENERKIRELQDKVDKINTKIALWSGSIIILAYIAQQLFEKVWR